VNQFQDNHRMAEKMNINLIRRRRSKHAFAVFLTLAIVLVTFTSLQNIFSVQADTVPLSVSLPSMNLTLVAANGTELVLNSTDIGSLPSYEASGGYRKVNHPEMIVGPNNYTGVTLITLCNLVGGISSNDVLRVNASDGYSMNFTYAQVNGDFVTYDPATGDEVQHNEPLTTILAYYQDDANLSSDRGPLRLAIVGSEGFVTDSTYWVYSVVKLEIITVAVPEFPSQMIVILFMIMTLFAAITYRKLHSVKSIAAGITRKES
jgi:hypothetical protein